MKSILLITKEKYPPRRADDKFIYEKYVSENFHIKWCTQSEDPSDAKQVIKGNVTYKVAKRDVGNFLLRLLNPVYAFTSALTALLRPGADVWAIQVKDLFFIAVFGLLSAKIYKKKFFFWLSFPFPEALKHRLDVQFSLKNVIHYTQGIVNSFLLYKIVLPNADEIFVQSEQMKYDIHKHAIDRKNMHVIPMGIDDDFVLTEAPAVEDTRIVLYLGTMNRIRRVDFVINVFIMIRERIPNAKLLMVGGSDDDGLDYLVDYVKVNGVENVIFTGLLSQEDAFEYVKQANVCLSPFYPTFIFNSTSPTKLIEYMALGKTTIVNMHPEQDIVVAESGAGFSVPYDPVSFADAAVAVLKNRETQIEMGGKGIEYVRKNRIYSIITQSVLDVYSRHV